MYISIEQSHVLDKTIKDFEVAFRSFISDTLISKYPSSATLSSALTAISLPKELIYAKRFASKLRAIRKDVSNIHKLVVDCHKSFTSGKFNNDVPYVSDLMDILLLFFDAHFLAKNISKSFSSIEEFHYCCSLYHKTRNNLSHPASRPVSETDAYKVIYFIENMIQNLDNAYFWGRFYS